MTDTNAKQQRPPTHTFNPNEYLMQLKSKEGSKDYLPVQWRLVWFREACPQGTIDTEEVEVDLDREMEEEVFVWNAERRKSEKVVKRAKGYARFRAIVTDGKGGRATGTKSECAASFSDYIEKAETGAIGRALAALGYGTQFAPEFNEEHRIVDSPVERSSSSSSDNRERGEEVKSVSSSPTTNTSEPRQATTRTPATTPSSSEKSASPASSTSTNEAKVTEQQQNSIEKLCEHLGKPAPSADELATISYIAAKDLITTLSKEYRDSRATAPQQKEATTRATITLKPREESPVTSEQSVGTTASAATAEKEAGDDELVTPQEITGALTIHFEALGKFAYIEAKKESGVGDIKTRGDLKRVLFYCLKWENNGEFEEWKQQPILPEQMAEINAYCAPTSFGSVAVQRLHDRLPALTGRTRSQFTREEADEFLGQLREKEPLYAVASYYDPDFAYLKRHFAGIVHPLDWACALPRDEDRNGRYEGYVAYLTAKIEQGGGIPKPLKKYSRAIGEMQELVALAKTA